VGSTFVFGSWICITDDSGKLQNRLMEILMAQDTSAAPTATLDQLAEKFSQLSISNPTQISKVLRLINFDSDTPSASNSEFHLGSLPEVPSPFPQGLRNVASNYQESLQDLVNPAQEIPLTGAQKGLMLSVTPQGYIIHWSSSMPDDTILDSSRLVGMVQILPYQDGDTIRDEDATTELLYSTSTAESGTNSRAMHTQEVFMVHARSPLIMPKAPDIRSLDETETNISPDALPPINETDEQKATREKKNKLCQGRWNHARHRKEVQRRC
jgi:hypothetical protein